MIQNVSDTIQQKHETAQSIVSYGIGCGGAWLGWVCDTSDLFQALAVFFGFIVVLIRSLHDGLRFIRAARGKRRS